jgi:hypothetical protein
MEVERGVYGKFGGTVLALASTDWGKIRKASLWMGSIPSEKRTGCRLNTSLDRSSDKYIRLLPKMSQCLNAFESVNNITILRSLRDCFNLHMHLTCNFVTLTCFRKTYAWMPAYRQCQYDL